MAVAMNNLGALLGSTGETAEALDLFRAAVAADPAYAEARTTSGSRSRARAVTRKPSFTSRRRSPKSRNGHRGGTTSGTGASSASALRRASRRMTERLPSSPQAPTRGAIAGWRFEDYDVPTTLSLRSSARSSADPRFAHALINLGIVLKEQRRSDAAIMAFERARAFGLTTRHCSATSQPCTSREATTSACANSQISLPRSMRRSPNRTCCVATITWSAASSTRRKVLSARQVTGRREQKRELESRPHLVAPRRLPTWLGTIRVAKAAAVGAAGA